MIKYLLTINDVIPMESPTEDVYYLRDVDFKLAIDNPEFRVELLKSLNKKSIIVCRLSVSEEENFLVNRYNEYKIDADAFEKEVIIYAKDGN